MASKEYTTAAPQEASEPTEVEAQEPSDALANEKPVSKPKQRAKRAPAKKPVARSSGKGKLSARESIVKVLSGAEGPMGVPDIVKAAVPLSRLQGKTPGQAIYSLLYSENRKPDGLFERVERGTFKLRVKSS